MTQTSNLSPNLSLSSIAALSCDTAAQHDELDRAISDWPDEIRAKAPTRSTHPHPGERRTVLERMRWIAIEVKATQDRREAEAARMAAAQEAERARLAAGGQWEQSTEAQRQAWRANGISGPDDLARTPAERAQFEAFRAAKLKSMGRSI